MDSHTRRFKATQGEFESISAYIESACADVTDEERLRVLLLVEELFANSVNHGYGGDSDAPVWLSLRVADDTLQLVYQDCAPAYNPFDAVDATATDDDVEHRRIGGLGIVLLVELSSSRHYERRGDRNVIELHVPRAAAG